MLSFNSIIWVALAQVFMGDVGALALGGALGAVLRWLIGLSLNHLSPHLIMGTLVANLLGAFMSVLCCVLA